MSILPLDGSLYVAGNYNVFINAPEVAAGDLTVRALGGRPAVESDLEELAPGLYTVSKEAIDCPGRGRCEIEVAAGEATATAEINTFVSGGVDTTPPVFTSSLGAPRNAALEAACERPVAFELDMSPALSLREENPEANGNILPFTANAVHLVERHTPGGEWASVGSLLGYTEREDRISVPVFIEENLGPTCYRAAAIDLAGNRTTDTSSVCFDIGL